MKTFFDKYGKSLNGSILVAIVVVGIIITAVWGGALGGFLGSILLRGVGTAVGAIIGAVASGWITFLSVIPAALWTEGHFGFLPDIVKSVITAYSGCSMAYILDYFPYRYDHIKSALGTLSDQNDFKD